MEIQCYLGVHERAAQCMFLCLNSSKGAYAIRIPCLRSGPRRLISRRLENQDGILRFIPGGEIYEQPIIRKEAFEDDAAIWSRMTEASFDPKGSWKQWLPFFGPIAVREVTVRFPTLTGRSMLSIEIQVPFYRNGRHKWALRNI